MKAIALALLLCGLGDAAAVPTVRAASPHAAAPAPSTLSLAAALDHANRVGPHRITPDLDCAVRYLANNFSQHLLPWADPSLAADARRLEADCGAPPTPSSPSAPGAPPAPIVAGAYFADAINGDDGAAGTQAAPFRSLARGLQATRTITPAAPAQLVLRAGTFYISAAVELTAADSGLTLSAFPGESPVISGGVSLAGLSWAAVPTPPPPPPPPPITAPVQGSLLCAPPIGCCVDGAGKSNPGVCAALAKTPDAATCSALCVANVSCTGYTWHDANTGDFADWCYARLDGVVDCDGAADHTSAWKPGDGPPTGPLNLWRATLPAGVRDFDQLFFRGRRITRARYPNSNPEIDLSPVGYMNPASWLSPNSFPAPQEMHIENVRPYDPWFPSFQWGSGGTVSNFTTGSFWGTRTPPAGDQYVVPAGVVMPPGVPFAGSWTNIEKGVVHAFQGGHWGNWLFEVGKADGSTLYFSRGGVQEARGGGGQAMYVDNVPELLDSAGEWYLNISARTLTIAFNGSDAAGNETLVAAQIAELVRATGSRASPVTDVVLNGLTFAHTLMDAFLPFTVPSGGDVSFHDGGMVRLAGTERVSVLGCTFAAPGGAGLQISEHNRATVVRGSHFAWTGSSAISSAGLGGSTPSGGPDFPEGTLIEGNLMREIGIYVKQSGGYYQGMSANVTVRGNVMFNAARAAINLNDGFAGGHLIASNLLFNSVRETNDHGAINSWCVVVQVRLHHRFSHPSSALLSL